MICSNKENVVILSAIAVIMIGGNDHVDHTVPFRSENYKNYVTFAQVCTKQTCFLTSEQDFETSVQLYSVPSLLCCFVTHFTFFK